MSFLRPDPQASGTTSLADVTVALWTPQGRGAVASIRVCGELNALFDLTERQIPFHAANGKSLGSQALGRAVFGTWGADRQEDVVLCRISDQVTEIHCHGGVAAARRILADCHGLQITIVDWQDQVAQFSGALVAECTDAVTRASTLRTASILLDQEAAWRAFATRIVTLAGADSWYDLSSEVEAAQSCRELGRHLLEPFLVVLTGPPNVGKSALLNALIGYQRSVVFDQPGTTRDVVTAETAFDGWPVRLIDTAGLRDDAIGLEAAGIELTYQQIGRADLILQISDASVGDESQIPQAAAGVRTILVANKIDLLDKARTLKAGLPVSQVSARTGAGVEELIKLIGNSLASKAPAAGTLIPFSQQQRVWLDKLTGAIEVKSAIAVEAVAASISAGASRSPNTR